MPPSRLMAYIDESGVTAHSPTAGPCFVLTAAMFDEERSDDVRALLARMRKDTNRSPKAVLHWNRIDSHSDRVHIAASVGAVEFITVSSVIVCKTRLPDAQNMSHVQRYLFAFRMLLERMTWLARGDGRRVHYTLAHIVGLHRTQLAEYKHRLFTLDEPTAIAWSHLDGLGDIDYPNRNELLQLADLCASATGAAFNHDKHGRVETGYLRHLLPRLYRHGASPLTSYGLKLHPASALADHPWINELK